jgi:hypothetical protein
MAWFFVDDHLHDHRKPRKAGLEAIGLWTLAGSWCADNLTDGFVPRDVAVRWSARKLDRLAAQLVDAGLWETAQEEGEDGWQFHDWTGWQRTRQQVEALRAKRSAAGALGGRKSGQSRSKTEANASPSASPSAQASEKQKRTPRADAPSALPIPSTELANASSAPNVADTSPPAAPDGAQALIAEWIDHCDGGRPPGRVIGQISREIGQMLTEGIPATDVRNGLAAWHGRGLHPSALASVVHEIRTASQRTPRSASPNSAENRLAKAAQIAAELRAERDQPPQLATVLDLPAIGSIP